jgi:hypothetical protein
MGLAIGQYAGPVDTRSHRSRGIILEMYLNTKNSFASIATTHSALLSDLRIRRTSVEIIQALYNLTIALVTLL